MQTYRIWKKNALKTSVKSSEVKYIQPYQEWRSGTILFCARVAVVKFNLQYFRQKHIIHNDQCISVMPVKISPCFILMSS